ncbi:MAG: Flp pilus assembly complex ATPase component TadA [Phycisphaeraceae bacterium]|nr:Flp pilus assembly complex ATPase component TadA [Phycisphaerales bacterium]MCB9859681.1 Flp pilus assembly complex ATPase component TadA [Phycisphaeraceae bacterium]
MGLGTLLVEKGLVSLDQLDAARLSQVSTGERLDHILIRDGIIGKAEIINAVAEQFHMPVVDLSTVTADPDLIRKIPAKIVHQRHCAPIAMSESGIITIATSDPFEMSQLDELRLITGHAIELVLAPDDDLQLFIRENYGVGSDTLDALAAERGLDITTSTEADTDELEQAQEASVVRLVNDILGGAFDARATDVHIEPYEHELTVRYRVDGVLQLANVPATISQFRSAIISRLKIMANLNIAEKRKPQDGRITFRRRTAAHGLQEFDLRMSVIPMLYGEGVVLRILNKTAVLMRLTDLGMPETMLERWNELITKPHGIVLVTGPTGSGKSTTLYASLNQIVSNEVKVITVEDPVEYHVNGVNQIQVNTKVGLDFAAGLRSILRHDPDVVMIGEIRDLETAVTAVQASLTGHMVFSTLHTNDAAGAMTRLLDMGVEPFLVTSSVEGVLAQRLVRRVCESCGEWHEVERFEVPANIKVKKHEKFREGPGCRDCNNTGYRGRIGVYELMRMSDDIRDMVMHRTSTPQIVAKAHAAGDLALLIEDGMEKARAGKTTIAEVMRALKA